ncbi:MAG: 30S ribosomal protein S12 methylthiotransferase RimO [Lachnospiraceae bacterium]|nr:30S ribosomal protein S12 methylthiotransferase RimO [Lachnospiraceae bacterium]
MKIFFVSLGCDKNLVDTEKMLGILNGSGFEITDDEDSADVVIVNTCCFIHDAKQESIETLLEYAQMKSEGNLKYLIAAGCLAQRYKDEIIKEIPEVDAVIGTYACGEIADVINRLNDRCRVYTSDSGNKQPGRKRLRSSISHYSYLKIAEGCDKHCTYCIIPSIRGSYRSFEMDELEAEARDLADNGVNELILVAQETTLYGTDIYGRKAIGELIDRLCAIDGIEWIRLMYCYPEEIGDEIINAFKKHPKMCRYIDMPIQHISDRILKAMGRKTNKAQIIDIIERLRKELPDIVIRTSLITGFPGETDEEHKELVDFVKDVKLERVGVFTYSKEENTPAAKMKGQVPRAVKNKRRKELMLAQQEVVFEKNRMLAGKTFRVMIDGMISEPDAFETFISDEDDDMKVYVARTYMDAPDIDGSVFVLSRREIISGSLTNVIIEGYNGYDLIGHEIIK